MWQLDPSAAGAYSRLYPRRLSPGCEHRIGCRCDPPDWVRCEYVDETGARCGGPTGHVSDHAPSRPAARTVAV